MHYSATLSNGGETSHHAEAPEAGVHELYTSVTTLERKLQRDGWTTITTRTQQTDVTVENRNPTRVEIIHETPLDYTAAINDIIHTDDIIATCTAKQRRHDWLFEIILLLNPSTDHGILLPTTFDTTQVATLTETHTTSPTLYSILTTPDGGQLGTIKHPNPQQFLPTQNADPPF